MSEFDAVGESYEVELRTRVELVEREVNYMETMEKIRSIYPDWY